MLIFSSAQNFIYFSAVDSLGHKRTDCRKNVKIVGQDNDDDDDLERNERHRANDDDVAIEIFVYVTLHPRTDGDLSLFILNDASSVDYATVKVNVAVTASVVQTAHTAMENDPKRNLPLDHLCTTGPRL